jgi:hypothetical protein
MVSMAHLTLRNSALRPQNNRKAQLHHHRELLMRNGEALNKPMLLQRFTAHQDLTNSNAR